MSKRQNSTADADSSYIGSRIHILLGRAPTHKVPKTLKSPQWGKKDPSCTQELRVVYAKPLQTLNPGKTVLQGFGRGP